MYRSLALLAVAGILLPVTSLNAWAGGSGPLDACYVFNTHTRACYPPNQIRRAQARMPGHPVNPVPAVRTVTSLPLRAISLEAGSMGPLTVIDYIFGSLGPPPRIGIPDPAPTHPKFVDVEEQSGAIAPTQPKVTHRDGMWVVTAELPHRPLMLWIGSNLKRASTLKIAQGILHRAL
jgi:hypothetical protein